MDTIKELISSVVNNPALTATITIGLSFFGWTFYRSLINILFTQKNIDTIGDKARLFVNKIKDERSRKLTRLKLVKVCVDVIRDMGFSRILNPNTQAILEQEKSSIL